MFAWLILRVNSFSVPYRTRRDRLVIFAVGSGRQHVSIMLECRDYSLFKRAQARGVRAAGKPWFRDDVLFRARKSGGPIVAGIVACQRFLRDRHGAPVSGPRT